MTGLAGLAGSRQRVRTRRRARGGGLVPAIIIGLYLVLAVVGPMLIDYDPVRTPLEDRLLAPGARTSTGATAPLGTDALGRDVFAQVVYGARTSVLIGTATVAVCVAIGMLIGFIAGYHRGWVDSVLTRFIDILQAFPGILLAIVIAGVFTPSLGVIIMALSVTGWISFARVARGSCSVSASATGSTRPGFSVCAPAACYDGTSCHSPSGPSWRWPHSNSPWWCWRKPA